MLDEHADLIKTSRLLREESQRLLVRFRAIRNQMTSQRPIRNEVRAEQPMFRTIASNKAEVDDGVPLPLPVNEWPFAYCGNFAT